MNEAARICILRLQHEIYAPVIRGRSTRTKMRAGERKTVNRKLRLAHGEFYRQIYEEGLVSPELDVSALLGHAAGAHPVAADNRS